MQRFQTPNKKFFITHDECEDKVLITVKLFLNHSLGVSYVNREEKEYVRGDHNIW